MYGDIIVQINNNVYDNANASGGYFEGVSYYSELK